MQNTQKAKDIKSPNVLYRITHFKAWGLIELFSSRWQWPSLSTKEILISQNCPVGHKTDCPRISLIFCLYVEGKIAIRTIVLIAIENSVPEMIKCIWVWSFRSQMDYRGRVAHIPFDSQFTSSF
jgi:hypothetical protein